MSVRLKDGGPAFARAAMWSPSGHDVSASQVGMSLRAYFAVYAPEMPDWWEWQNPEPRPELLRADKELSPEHYQQWQGLGDWLEEKDVDAKVLEFCERNNARNAESKTWRLRADMGKLSAWRWFYADSMLDSAA